MREWHKKNPEYARAASLKKNYGVSVAWYDAQLDKQAGVCAICHKPETQVINAELIRLSVDHCHETGKIRGLLCRQCNTGIGALRHSLQMLEAAKKYLEATE